MKKQFIVITAILLIATSGCIKENCTKTSSDYLKLDWGYINLSNKQDFAKTVQLQSNIEWKISFEAPVPDWVTVDKTSGKGNGLLQIKSIKDNNTGLCRLATVMASPVKSSVLPVRLTIGQCDSLFNDSKQF